MATVPRGIQPVKHTNKDGSTTVKYRVRIVRKKIKEDRRFDDLKEAKEFLANSKSVKGVEKIKFWSKTEEELKQAKFNNDSRDYSLGYFIDLYVFKNITKGLTEEEINSLPELDRRNVKNKISFYKTIKNTSIIDKTITYQEKLDMSIEDEQGVYVKLSGFDIRKIGPIQIDDYIAERLKTGVAKISVAREITHISNVFRKLRNLSENIEIANLPNIVLQHDKDLLIERNKRKRKINLTDEEQQKLFEELSKKQNQDMLKIATISILTSLRRSEIVFLTKSQVYDNHIELYRGKNGNPRDVIIDKVAQDYIHSLEVVEGSDRYFSYKSISGFGKMFYDFLKEQKLQGKFRFHDFRRIAITRKVVELGAKNSMIIAEILGISSERKLKELYIDPIIKAPETQEDLMKTFAHSSTDTTRIYLSIPTPKTKKLVDR